MSDLTVCFLPEKIFHVYENVNNKEKLIEDMRMGFRVSFNAIWNNNKISTTISCGNSICSIDQFVEPRNLDIMSIKGDILELGVNHYKAWILESIEKIMADLDITFTQKLIPIYSGIF